MRFIEDNKIYDTNKAELLCTFQKQYEQKTIWGSFYPMKETKLYKTAKGAYFIVVKCSDHYRMGIVGEATAKEYLMHNNYDKYVEMFGELEEA